MLEKSLKFILSKKAGTVAFNLGFVRLLAEFDPISEKQDYKGDVLEACITRRVEMVFALSKEVVTLYIGSIIV